MTFQINLHVFVGMAQQLMNVYPVTLYQDIVIDADLQLII